MRFLSMGYRDFSEFSACGPSDMASGMGMFEAGCENRRTIATRNVTSTRIAHK
ncbi:MAG: hypothetical protein LBJ61_12390 [Deltaproteobacteria bacterium]|jgi:hypothetical protein|nr:hypothetical protein [Deltaproteobacteria bacterium]